MTERQRKQARRRLDHAMNDAANPRYDRPRRHRAARQAARVAEKLGILIRPAACECCGDRLARLERHHWDYSKPLNVDFLCGACHGEADAILRNEKDSNRADCA